MGGLFFSPKPPVLPAPAAPVVKDDGADEEKARRERLDLMDRRRRGRGATIATSPRGLLVIEDWVPRRKSLLGE